MSPPIVAVSSAPAPPPVEWVKTYGGAESASSVQQTSDGGYILFGGWVVKVDFKGDMQWNKTFSEFGYEMIIWAGQQSSDGGFMLAGNIPGTKVINGSVMTEDVFAIKTDGTGNVQWEKFYGESGHQAVFSAQQTSDGGFVLAGVLFPSIAGYDDFYLVKTDSFGNVVWSKTYGATTASEVARSVQQTPDGGFILAGEKFSSSPRLTDGWVLKTDANGNMIWNKTFGTTNYGEAIYCVRTTNDGGYIMAGCKNRDPDRSSATGDFWLFKTDKNGDVQWDEYYGEGGVKGKTESANSVQQTIDGGFIAVGNSGGNEIWLIKTGSDGRMIWNETFAGSASAVVQTSDRGYAIAGSKADLGFLLIKIMRANPPIANYTAKPNNPMVGQKVLFNASATNDLDNDIRNYTWNFGDAYMQTTTEPTVTHSFSSPGNYNVSLTVADGEDLASSVFQEIYVRINTSVSVIASSRITPTGLAVNISGTLRDMFGQPVMGKPVILYYSLSQACEYHPITSVTTDTNGIFAGTWLPSGPGQFSIKVEWAGDTVYFPSRNITNVAMMLDEDGYLFFVQSNSTLTALIFDSINQELNFTATGPAGTLGYVRAYIPKTFVANIANVAIYLDGNQINYKVTSFDESWLFHFSYPHSSHIIVISLNVTPQSFLGLQVIDLAITGIAILAVVTAVFLVFRRKRVKK